MGSESGSSVNLVNVAFGSYYIVNVENEMDNSASKLTSSSTARSSFSTSTSSLLRLCARACFLGFVGLRLSVIAKAITINHSRSTAFRASFNDVKMLGGMFPHTYKSYVQAFPANVSRQHLPSIPIIQTSPHNSNHEYHNLSDPASPHPFTNLQLGRLP